MTDLYDTFGNTLESFRETKNALLEDGWVNRAPGAQAEEIDRNAVERYPCAECGGHNMGYEPFVKYEGEVNTWTGLPKLSYLAFLICHDCGAWSEF